MSSNIKCLECSNEIKSINSLNNEDNIEPFEENDEKLKKLIKEREENINFKINACICLNCYDKFIREREKSNLNDSNENNLLTDALQNLLCEFESTDINSVSPLNEKSLIEEEIKLKQEYEELLKEEKKTGNQLEKLLEELKFLSEKEEKIAEAYYELEFNSIIENKKVYMLRNKANIIQYQLSEFDKFNIMNQLFEFSFGENQPTINGFSLTSLWPIELNSFNEIISGWSVITHLTYVLSYKFRFESNKYLLYPFGVNTKIINKMTKEIYEM